MEHDDPEAEGMEDGENGGPETLIAVYFPGPPKIDEAALLEWLNTCDPDEDDRWVLTASAPPLAAPGGPEPDILGTRRILSFGAFQVMLLDHNVPSPDSELFELPTVPEEYRDDLKAHRGFTLAMVFDGEGYPPIERALVCTKIALGLVRQGAIGYGVPMFATAFPASLLLQAEESILADAQEAAQSPSDDPDDAPPKNIWDMMRTAIEPRALVFPMAVMEGDGGREWASSRGMGFYGLPEVIVRIGKGTSQEMAVDIAELVAKYQLTAGDVLDVGHTMGVDERAAVRIVEPTQEEQENFDSGYGVLVATLGDDPKKSSAFGRLLGR